MDFDKLNIVVSEDVDENTIYLVSLATREEIMRGEYIEVLGIKLSKNKKKFSIIKNIGVIENGQ